SPASGDPMSYTFAELQHVVFRGTDGHVHELWVDLVLQEMYTRLLAKASARSAQLGEFIKQGIRDPHILTPLREAYAGYPGLGDQALEVVVVRAVEISGPSFGDIQAFCDQLPRVIEEGARRLGSLVREREERREQEARAERERARERFQERDRQSSAGE